MSVFQPFCYYVFTQQDFVFIVALPCPHGNSLLVFSKNLCSMILCLNLLWTKDTLNNAVFIDDESSAESTHIGASIHLLLTVHTECLNQFQVSIGNERERQFVLLNELLVRFLVLYAGSDDRVTLGFQVLVVVTQVACLCRAARC